MFVKVKRFLKEGYSIKEVDGIFEFTASNELEAGQYVDVAGTLYRVSRVNIYYLQEDITSCEMERVTKPFTKGGFWNWLVELFNWR